MAADEWGQAAKSGQQADAEGCAMVSWFDGGTGSGWETVTVYRGPDELLGAGRDEVLGAGRYPAPLARLGDGVELRVRPAPGGRGTELAARLRGAGRLTAVTAYLSGDDPRLALRAALCQAKQLAETGEVLRPDRPGGSPRRRRPRAA